MTNDNIYRLHLTSSPSKPENDTTENLGLTTSAKTHLAEMLGGSLNIFYYELALRICEISKATKDENGGLMEFTEIQARVMRGRDGSVNGGIDVSE